jgi:hypothetical protein
MTVIMRALSRVFGFAASLLPMAAASGADNDRHTEFLRAISGETGAAAALYQALIADPIEAKRRLAEWGNDPETDAELPDQILMFAAIETKALTNTDWVSDSDEVLDGFEHQLKRFGKTLLPADRAAVVAYADSHLPIARGDYIGWMYGPLAALAEGHGLAVLNVNSGSDSYHFVLVTPATFMAWRGVQLSKMISIEDPAVQFTAQLSASPYQRFHQRSLPP